MALLPGCAAGSKEQVRQVVPADFAGVPTTQPNAGAPTARDVPPVGGPSGPAGEREIERTLEKLPRAVIVAGTPPATSQPASYTLDGMVGQVNGQPIYAYTFFEPIHEQLATIGRREPRLVFQQRARELIIKRLDEIVFDALILGEAERDLSSQEQQGLQNMLKEQREEFLRQFGQGSLALANARLGEREGMTLDQKMTATRQKIIVQRYLRQKLLPKINVTRKDIERYYNDHLKEYNPPAGRTLRVIRAMDAAAADKIDKLLHAGTPFADVAGSRINQYLPEQRGLLQDTNSGEKIFGPEPLNEALAKLKPGQHSPRVQLGESSWWVFLESINAGKARPLRDAQLEIEELLRRQRFQMLSQRYRQRLMSEGSFNSLDEMTEAMMRIALSRYATPE